MGGFLVFSRLLTSSLQNPFLEERGSPPERSCYLKYSILRGKIQRPAHPEIKKRPKWQAAS